MLDTLEPMTFEQLLEVHAKYIFEDSMDSMDFSIYSEYVTQLETRVLVNLVCLLAYGLVRMEEIK
jgi:hypothetical protein